ncbi:hypothetical protein SAZ10_32910 [Mesorhizobium sp. BAC0120]|uniref:hypothetical protein n=1 Tax=Mesorhizobium sp. BAC0120 TaxID=3090670 RepID=UPI00298D3B8B|nr:hypothetical protein [Mesorhizobium sp. BAC0120]MDW6026572.1 hypothetical protein [Mesorhizobium sp. BAC0120]
MLRVSEPIGTYWAIGVVASLALHASGVAGAVLLGERYVRDTVPTEITFSSEASPVAQPAPAAAEHAIASEVAAVAERESLAPALAETTAKSAPEALKPVTEAAATIPERAQPLKATAPETAQSLRAAALAPQAVPSLKANQVKPEVLQATQAGALASAPAEAVRPSAARERAQQSQAERVAVAERGPAIASEAAERLASSTPAAAAPLPGEAAETIGALEQREGVGAVAASAAEQAASPDKPAASPPRETIAALPPPKSNPEPAGASALSAGSGEVVAVLLRRETVANVAPPSAQQATPSAKPDASPSFETVAPVSPPASNAEPAIRPQPQALRPAPSSSDAPTNLASALSSRSETAQPLGSSGETVTGLVPEGGQLPVQAPANVPEAVVPAKPEEAKTVERPVETALLVPARPGSSLGSEVDKPSDRYRRIVDFIRHYGGGDCFIALPAMKLDGDVTFQTFGRDKAREDAFRQALLGLDGLKAEISSGNVADPQCLALSFARKARRYPGFSLMIDLHNADMASGTRLSGSVLNANGRELHLLLVDDEGQVQSMDRFLSADNGTDRTFSTPLTLTGGPVATKQILVAITADPTPPSLNASVNEAANEFFVKLGKEIEAIGADVDLAVEGFTVR